MTRTLVCAVSLLAACSTPPPAAPEVTVTESNYTEGKRNPPPEIETPHEFGTPPVSVPEVPEYEATWWTEEKPCPEGASLVGGAPPEHEVVGCRTDKGVNEGRFTEFYPSGKKKEEGGYAKHFASGVWVSWDEEGRVQKVSVYNKGKRDGVETEYFPSGKVKSQRTYRAGARDGLTTLWDEQGVKRSVLEYQNGKQHGATTYWDEKGAVARVEHWKAGQKVEP